jgi:hypothetical protein
VLGPVAGSEDHHREFVAAAADLGQDIETVAAGEPEVEDEEVEVAIAGDGGGGWAVLHGEGAEAVCPQTLLEERGDPGFVFGDQDARHWSGLSSP